MIKTNLEKKEKKRIAQRAYRLLHKEECTKRNKAWAERNRDKMSSYELAWEKKYPVRYMLTRARYRAKKNGIDFSIEEKDIFIPEICPYTGVRLVLTRGASFSDRPSLDRIDNSKGYIPGNVQVISHKANVAKSDLSVDELINFAKHIFKRHLNLEV